MAEKKHTADILAKDIIEVHQLIKNAGRTGKSQCLLTVDEVDVIIQSRADLLAACEESIAILRSIHKKTGGIDLLKVIAKLDFSASKARG